MFDCHGIIKHVLMNIYCQECPLFSAGLPDPFSALPFSMAQETDFHRLIIIQVPGPSGFLLLRSANGRCSGKSERYRGEKSEQ